MTFTSNAAPDTLMQKSPEAAVTRSGPPSHQPTAQPPKRRLSARLLLNLLSANVYIQLLTLVHGLLFNFGFPLAFGMKAYGSFLQYVLPTLLVSAVIGTASEALIPTLEPDEIFAGAFVAGLLMGGVASLAFALAGAHGPDLLLLVSMISSSSTMLACYRNRLQWEVVGLLGIICATFIGLTVLQ
ncbi:MAG: hypothetical protein ACRELF_26135, partial [Gemmataceae bacterium]